MKDKKEIEMEKRGKEKRGGWRRCPYLRRCVAGLYIERGAADVKSLVKIASVGG